MKIDQVRMTHIRMPLSTRFETSFGAIDQRECILIQLFSEGESGWGECVADRDPGYSYETASTAWVILRDFLFPSISGRDFATAGELRDNLDFVRGNPMAKAGLEMAMWDLVGKAQSLSLQEMISPQAVDEPFGVNTTELGNDRVPVGVSVGLQRDPGELVDVVGRYLQAGYARIKIKIKPGRDVEDTAALRRAFPDVGLQVDANSAYSLESASRLKPLDDLSLLLIEQPLADDDLWDHSKLQKEFQTPLCLDESIHSQRHVRQAIEMGACRIVNIKVGRVGGLTEAVKIHDYCLARDVPVWCGGMLETGVGRAANLALASLPGFRLPGDISATERYYLEDITVQRFTLNPDSTIDVPKGHGLGIDVDEGKLNKFRINELVIKS